MSWFGNHRCINSVRFGFLILAFIGSVAFFGSVAFRPLPVNAVVNCRQIPTELIIQFQHNISITETPTPDWLAAQIPLLDSLFNTARLQAIVPLTQPHSLKNPEKLIAVGYRLIFSESLNFPEILPRLNQTKILAFAEPNYCYSAATLPQPPLEMRRRLPLNKLHPASAGSVKARMKKVVIGLIDDGFERDDRNCTDSSGTFSAGIVPLTAFAATSTDSRTGHGYLLGNVIQRFLTELKSDTELPVKILPLIPTRHESDHPLCATGCAAAIEYAVLHQAKIILLGWSGAGSSKFLENSINWAVSQGALVVAAAGNQNQKAPVYPAAWPRVLAVAATDGRDLKTPNSNFGDWVDVSAQGNWAGALPQNQPGTSIAAAVVAGLAALIQATERDLTPDSLLRRIIFSCDNIDSLNPDYTGLLGAGRVNALQSIKGISQPNIILREHQFELTATRNGSDSTGIPAQQRLTLVFENIAADARNIVVEVANLPAAIQVTPAQIQISELKFRQIKKYEFLFQTRQEWTPTPIQIKVDVQNFVQRTFPLKIEPQPVSSVGSGESLHNPLEISDYLFRTFDFQPQRITILPASDSPARLFVLGSDSLANAKGAFWEAAQATISFDIKLDSSESRLFSEDFNADGFRDLGLMTGTRVYIFPNQGARPESRPAATFLLPHPLSVPIFEPDPGSLPEGARPAGLSFPSPQNGNNSAYIFAQPAGYLQTKIADLNLDGIPDRISLFEATKQLHLLQVNPNSGITTAINLEIPASDFVILPLDSDFANDLVVVESKPSGAVLKIFRNRAGQFSAMPEIAISPVRKILPGDLDQDLDFDLLLLPENAPPQIWLNNGEANFTPAPVGLTQDILSDGILLDFDGNGTLDLAGINPEAHRAQLFLINNSDRPAGKSPAQPENLRHSTDSSRILLKWDAPATAATTGLTYELNLTDALDTEKIVGNPFRPGNLGQCCQFRFPAKPGKKYYWTVQTVDAAYHRSAWTPVQTVQLPTAPQNICVFWPHRDTTLTPGDSLRFQVGTNPPDDSLQIRWQTRSDQSGRKSVFIYQVPAGRRAPDSVWVTVSARDTTFQFGWQIKIQRANLPPQILAKFPAEDSLRVHEGDSLAFKIRARDADQDSLVFHWLNVNRHAGSDSVLWVKWNYFSAGKDSVGVRVADADTVIEHWWHVLVKNTNRAPEIRNPFPKSDTTLVSGDSLRIRLEIFDPDSQPVSISWEKNDSTVAESGNQSFYRYVTPTGFPKPDTIIARFSDGDTTIIRQWIITTGPALKITHFWPLHDTLLVEGDSLEFRVRAFCSAGDSLTYSWSVNQQRYPATDSLFRYRAIFSPPGIDTIKIQVAYRNVRQSHTWRVQVPYTNTPPSPPAPRFPRLGEVVPESGKLQWRPGKDPDPSDQRLTYFIQIATDSTFLAICSADSVKGDTVLALPECTGRTQFESGKTYFWRVLAVDCCRDTSCFSRTRAVFRFQHVSARIVKAYAKDNTENGITIFWETTQEKGNLGFNILRKTAQNGEFRRLNEMLIRGTSPYSHLDGDVQAGVTYFYCIECVSVTGLTFRHDVIEVSAPVPEVFALHQNYPNPLTFETLIRFEIPRECQVALSVYNILGEEVRRLVKETREKGFYDVIWNGRDENDREVGSGIYFYSITAENFHETRKIMVVR